MVRQLRVETGQRQGTVGRAAAQLVCGPESPPDLVDRQYNATRPNALCVTDLTYVATWAGTAYVCFMRALADC